jgi:hypothetical protein
MLQSRINQTILYKESRTIDESDDEFETYLFSYPINNYLTYIVLGNIDYQFFEQRILFIRAYLYEDKKITDQIGIFEFAIDKKDYILDENEDIDLTKIDDIITFSFVNDKYLNGKFKSILDVDEDDIESKELDTFDDDVLYEDIDEENEQSNDNDDLNVVDIPTEKKALRLPDAEIASELPEQTFEQSLKERKSFKFGSNTAWIEKFMKNNNYGLIDNEGGGDCFFAVLRDSLLGININLSVDEMRNVISANATDDQFKSYYDLYNMNLNEIDKTTLQINEKKQLYNKLQDTYKKHKDRNKQKEITNEARDIQKKYKQLVKERTMALDNITEFNFMKDVKTLDDFKSILLSVNYWADSWSISVLERELNIKIIIMSSSNYDTKNLDNVLICGDMVHEEIRNESITFNPMFYIIADHTGDHYKLITYKNKRIFTFEDIPYDVKDLILTKCMENKSNTLYNYISKFKNYFIEKTKQMPVIDEVEMAETGPSNTVKPGDKSSCLVQFGNQDLYNSDIVFQFYSKSADKRPGLNAPAEKMIPAREKDFIELSEISNWRRVLSNFHVGKFELDGLEWNSVEHYYQANKFKKNNSRLHELFSLSYQPRDDDPTWFRKIPTNLNIDPNIAKSLGDKIGKYKGVLIRPKDIKPDADFFDGNNHKNVLLVGQRAKYKQIPLAKKVLLATRDAKLQHFSRGCPPIVFYDTMAIRDELQG